MTVVARMTETSDVQMPQDMPVHDARTLITRGVQACIQLDDQTYFLRITRANKLILTK